MTNRRDFIVKFTMAAGAVSFLKPLNVFAGIGDSFPVPLNSNVLTILHTANIKGQWHALGINEKMAGLGGLQNIAKKIADIRNENPTVVAIDAGNITRHRQTREERLNFYKKVSHAGYDAIVPGGKDLALGPTYFTEMANEREINVVSSDKSSNGTLLPYSVLKKGKIRIGIINAGTAALKNTHHTSILQASATMNQTAHLLRSSKNCTIIISVVQSSIAKCSKLASLSNGIDVMISSADKTSLHNTQIVKNKSDHEVIVSYAGSKGVMMSRIDITFNKEGEKINMASKAVFAGADDESHAGIVKKCAMHNVLT